MPMMTLPFSRRLVLALLAACACARAATLQEAMTAALSDWVAAQNEVSAAQVRIGPLDTRVPVQPCAGSFQFDYPFVSRDSVRVRCTKPAWQMFVKVGFAGTGTAAAPAAPVPASPRPAPPAAPAENRQAVVVAAAQLAPGQLLQPELLKMERLDAEKVTRAHLIDTGGLDGHEVLRPIRAGEPIRSSDIRPATLVKKGELVNLSIGSPGNFLITVKLEAMQDGRLGEQIRMRNPESGRMLTGVVTGRGLVRGG